MAEYLHRSCGVAAYCWALPPLRSYMVLSLRTAETTCKACAQPLVVNSNQGIISVVGGHLRCPTKILTTWYTQHLRFPALELGQDLCV